MEELVVGEAAPIEEARITNAEVGRPDEHGPLDRQVNSKPTASVAAAFFVDLGDRLSTLSFQNAQRRQQERMEKNLVFVFTFLAFCLAAVNGATYAVVNALFGHEWHLQHSEATQSQEDQQKYASIVKDTVPFIQSWYANLDSSSEPLLPYSAESMRWQSGGRVSRVMIGQSGNITSCHEDWFTALADAVPYVDSNEAALVLETMGLLDVPAIAAAMEPLLREGALTSTKEYAVRASSCLMESRAISDMACAFLGKSQGGGLGYSHDTATKLVARAVVLDALTEALVDNFMLLPMVVGRMEGQQRDLFTAWSGDWVAKDVNEFRTQKYDGLAVGLREHAQSAGSNRQNAKPFTAMLQVNILEAVKVDIVNGFYDNARVGLALAAATSWGHAAVEPSYENHQMHWPLGKGWVEAYLAWNLAFVSGLARSKALPVHVLAPKLLIPSISCQMTEPNGATFADRRFISLALFTMGLNEKSMGPRDTPMDPGVDRDFVELFGHRNLHNLKLPSPSKETVNHMLSELCGEGKACTGKLRPAETSPTYALEEEYSVFSGFVLYVTMMLTGVGLECFVFWYFLSGMIRWGAHMEVKWRLAQFLFSLVALVSLSLAFIGNALGAITTVLCLWKFGFPECVTYVYTGLFAAKESNLRRLAEVFNGVGLVVHHGAASVIIAMLIAGVLEAGRHIGDPVAFLAMQHWFVMVRYVSFPAYLVVELVLEVFFEWSALASLERLYLDHWTGAMGATTMVFAHWILIGAGALELAAVGGIGKLSFQRSAQPKRQGSTDDKDDENDKDGENDVHLTETHDDMTEVEHDDDVEASSNGHSKTVVSCGRPHGSLTKRSSSTATASTVADTPSMLDLNSSSLHG